MAYHKSLTKITPPKSVKVDKSDLESLSTDDSLIWSLLVLVVNTRPGHQVAVDVLSWIPLSLMTFLRARASRVKGARFMLLLVWWSDTNWEELWRKD